MAHPRSAEGGGDCPAHHIGHAAIVTRVSGGAGGTVGGRPLHGGGVVDRTLGGEPRGRAWIHST